MSRQDPLLTAVASTLRVWPSSLLSCCPCKKGNMGVLLSTGFWVDDVFKPHPSHTNEKHSEAGVALRMQSSRLYVSLSWRVDRSSLSTLLYMYMLRI